MKELTVCRLRKARGRAFHAIGAATVNERRPKLVTKLSTTNRLALQSVAAVSDQQLTLDGRDLSSMVAPDHWCGGNQCNTLCGPMPFTLPTNEITHRISSYFHSLADTALFTLPIKYITKYSSKYNAEKWLLKLYKNQWLHYGGSWPPQNP